MQIVGTSRGNFTVAACVDKKDKANTTPTRKGFVIMGCCCLNRKHGGVKINSTLSRESEELGVK